MPDSRAVFSSTLDTDRRRRSRLLRLRGRGGRRGAACGPGRRYRCALRIRRHGRRRRARANRTHSRRMDNPMQVGAEDLAVRRDDRRQGAARVRGRRARGGDAARLPRHRQGPPRRLARLPEELPDDDLRLVRDAHGRRRRARLQGADVRHRERRPRARDLRDGEPARRSRTSSSTWIPSGPSSRR